MSGRQDGGAEVVCIGRTFGHRVWKFCCYDGACRSRSFENSRAYWITGVNDEVSMSMHVKV
jgi:hypothetical protein